MQENKAAYDETLPCLDAVDTRINVDRVRAEHSKHPHVNVVQDAEVHDAAKEWLEEARHNHAGHSVVSNE